MKLLTVLLPLIFCQIAFANPATYQENLMNIPQGAVMNENDPAYFTEIELDHQGDGSFKLVSAKTNNLIYADSINITILDTLPVQVNVTVAGNKSVPCVELLPPAISRQNDVFTVVLAETRLGPAVTCAAVLDPFETTFALDVTDLPAGTYKVKVNGQIEKSFTLDSN